MANEENLKPIKPGERRAAKSDSERRTKTLAIRVTDDEHARANELAAADGETFGKWARRKLGI